MIRCFIVVGSSSCTNTYTAAILLLAPSLKISSDEPLDPIAEFLKDDPLFQEANRQNISPESIKNGLNPNLIYSKSGASSRLYAAGLKDQEIADALSFGSDMFANKEGEPKLLDLYGKRSVGLYLSNLYFNSQFYLKSHDTSKLVAENVSTFLSVGGQHDLSLYILHTDGRLNEKTYISESTPPAFTEE